jgi:signal transduction histidine kinase
MDVGADDFLAKPFHQDELRVRVREGERVVRLEQTLADQNRQLRETQTALVQSEKLASLGQLAAGMAHEINNPIAFVTNNLSVLKRDVMAVMEILEAYRRGRESWMAANGALAEEAARQELDNDLSWIRENLPRLFDASLEGLARVRAVVKNLREFARLDEAECDELNINAAIQTTLTILKPEIEQKHLEVETDFKPLLPLQCRPSKINQVLYNVLLNAIQASQRGGPIQLRTHANSDTIEVEVEDHGCGIDAAHLPRIFEPFFSTRPVGQGQGLGLAISYGIVRDHGGSITVKSQLGQGSVFRISLPRSSGAAQSSASTAQHGADNHESTR